MRRSNKCRMHGAAPRRSPTPRSRTAATPTATPGAAPSRAWSWPSWWPRRSRRSGKCCGRRVDPPQAGRRPVGERETEEGRRASLGHPPGLGAATLTCLPWPSRVGHPGARKQCCGARSGRRTASAPRQPLPARIPAASHPPAASNSPSTAPCRAPASVADRDAWAARPAAHHESAALPRHPAASDPRLPPRVIQSARSNSAHTSASGTRRCGRASLALTS